MLNFNEFIYENRFYSLVNESFELVEGRYLIAPNRNMEIYGLLTSTGLNKEIRAYKMPNLEFLTDLNIEIEAIKHFDASNCSDFNQLYEKLIPLGLQKTELADKLKNHLNGGDSKIIEGFVRQVAKMDITPTYDLKKIITHSSTGYLCIKFKEGPLDAYSPLIYFKGKKFEFYNPEQTMNKYFNGAIVLGSLLVGGAFLSVYLLRVVK